MSRRVTKTFRFALLITGLVLLVVFGARAASQASDKALAGAPHKNTVLSSTTPSFFGLSPFGAQKFSEVSPSKDTTTTMKPVSTVRSEAQATETPAAAVTQKAKPATHKAAPKKAAPKKSKPAKSKASSTSTKKADSASDNSTKKADASESQKDKRAEREKRVERVIHRTQNLFVRLLF